MKKAKKVADTVTENVKSVSDSEDTQNVAGKISGATVINPISKYIEVEPVGLYGISQTETSGNVYLVLNVLNKTDKQNALFGSSVQNQKMLAVDGKVYNVDASGGIRYDTPQDVPVHIEEASDPSGSDASSVLLFFLFPSVFFIEDVAKTGENSLGCGFGRHYVGCVAK